jgi:hypothetical protein
MEKFFGTIVVGVGLVGLAFVLSVLGGTFVWLIWPVSIPMAFPGLVTTGVIAAKLTWWQSVCITWLFGILIKSSGSSVSKKS